MILTKKVFSGMINKASGALNMQLVFVCLQKPRLFVNKKYHPPNFLKICSSNVDFSSQKEKSHQNEAEHRQNEQKRKSKQRAQRHLVAKFWKCQKTKNGLFHYPNHPRKYESSKSICIKTMVICKIRKNTQKSTLLDVFCCNFGTRSKKSKIFVFPESLHMYWPGTAKKVF